MSLVDNHLQSTALAILSLELIRQQIPVFSPDSPAALSRVLPDSLAVPSLAIRSNPNRPLGSAKMRSSDSSSLLLEIALSWSPCSLV